ncbi:MAG TPA: T9SS type A sorting domain-containing protein [Phaeodactylibacter sp.]|nr:T9SS type A sorting domain-containing protein [Phaeodactylibacter sp.]
MVRYMLLLVLIFGVSLNNGMAQNALYHRAQINLKGHQLSELAQLGIETDHGQLAPGRYLINDFSEAELARIHEAGFSYQILIEDVGSYYANPNRQPEISAFAKSQNCEEGSFDWGYETPQHYEDGSMGGYFTWQEMVDILDQMRAAYPQLISAKQVAGYSHEERPIYWVRVSDNPDADEEEPEILYTALHHAREPNSLSQMIFYLWYLLENYASDPEVQYLVDNTEMYFIPCINPDGYVYNETIAPEGGGLWRKNRWVNPDNGDTNGVDLNRNYGYQWGYDDYGSSDNPQSNVFRGTAPFSEPETQAVRQLANAHQFQIALNYHTYGNLLIHPWGYNDQPTTEDAIFKGFGKVMTRDNKYLVGTGVETVGYIVNGDSDDWMYGEQSEKPRIFSLTPEVGPSFWPAPSQIDELNKSVMLQNLTAAHLLLNYVEVEETNPQVNILADGQIELSAKQYGLQAGAVDLWVEGIEPYLSVNASPQTLQLQQLEETSLSIPFTISADAQTGDPLTFVIHTDNGLYERTDTLQKTYLQGTSETLFSDAGDNLDDWATYNNWGITTEDYHSPYSSFTDSPNSTYGDDAYHAITLDQLISIPEDALAVELTFYAKWEIESNWDYAQVFAIINDTAFIPLCGQYTNFGSGSFQPNGEPLYDGVQNEWVKEHIDLSDYIGQEIKIGFRLLSDEYQQFDGFYFDDVEIKIVMPQPTGSTSQSLNEGSLRLFPNPTAGNAQLFFMNPGEKPSTANIRLTDMTGRELFKFTKNIEPGDKLLTLPTAGLPAGIYILQVQTPDAGYVVKLKKE